MIRDNYRKLGREVDIFVQRVTKISNLAKERDINLRMFKKQANQKRINTIEKVTFEAAMCILYNLMMIYDLPRFVRDDIHLQKMLDGKFFLKKGEKGFENLIDQKNVKYVVLSTLLDLLNLFVFFQE